MYEVRIPRHRQLILDEVPERGFWQIGDGQLGVRQVFRVLWNIQSLVDPCEGLGFEQGSRHADRAFRVLKEAGLIEYDHSTKTWGLTDFHYKELVDAGFRDVT